MPQAEAAQAAEKAAKAREESDSVRVAAAVADARAEAELLERQRAHGEQVDGHNQQLERLRSEGSIQGFSSKACPALQSYQMLAGNT